MRKARHKEVISSAYSYPIGNDSARSDLGVQRQSWALPTVRLPQGFRSHHVISMSLCLALRGAKRGADFGSWSQATCILIREMGMTHTQVSCRWDWAVCKWAQGGLEGREHCGPVSRDGWPIGEGLLLTLRAGEDFCGRPAFWAACGSIVWGIEESRQTEAKCARRSQLMWSPEASRGDDPFLAREEGESWEGPGQWWGVLSTRIQENQSRMGDPGRGFALVPPALVSIAAW